MKSFNCIILILIILTGQSNYSQTFNDDCPFVELNSQARFTQTGGLYKPPNNAPEQYFRVLFVFVEFSEDNRSFTDWPFGQLPTYANKLVDTSIASQYRSFTLSDYWKTMSFGNFDFIGDVYPTVITLSSESWYKNNGKYYQDCNKDVLDSINGKMDFKKYDNWGFDSQTNGFVFNPRNGDGYLDMIYIIYRKPKNVDNWFTRNYGDWSGICVLGNNLTYTTHDGTIIDGNWLWQKASGITINKGAGVDFLRYIGILGHEYGHYLFGPYHTRVSGIMGERSTFSLSGWERERLGYSAYTVPNQDNYTITLQDFVTTGQLLKIPVPNSSTDYFLVENHQRLSKYDQIMQGGQLQGTFDTNTTLGKGIYVWFIRNGNSFLPNDDIKTANGNFNWSYDGDYYAGPGWYVGKPWEGYLPKTKRASVNRDGHNKSDRWIDHIYWNGHYASKWVDQNPETKQYEITCNVLGIETHPFNYNYNRLFTPWSSPSTYVNDVTNVAMQIFSQNGNNITVKVFNTYNSCLSLPPSKPQLLQVEASITNHPKLSWALNEEPDISGYKIYKKVTSEQGWQLLTMVPHPIAIYEDVSEICVDPNNWQFIEHYLVEYKITAFDTQSLESLPSDIANSMVKGEALEKISLNESDFIYELKNNYPNPFNPTTKISYSIKERGLVTLKLYDILGKEVMTLVNVIKDIGTYEVNLNASNLSSGVYLYTMQSGAFYSSRKLVVVK